MSQNKQRTGSFRPHEKIVFNKILGLKIDDRPSTSDDQTQSKHANEKLLASKQEKGLNEVFGQKLKVLIE